MLLVLVWRYRIISPVVVCCSPSAWCSRVALLRQQTDSCNPVPLYQYITSGVKIQFSLNLSLFKVSNFTLEVDEEHSYSLFEQLRGGEAISIKRMQQVCAGSSTSCECISFHLLPHLNLAVPVLSAWICDCKLGATALVHVRSLIACSYLCFSSRRGLFSCKSFSPGNDFDQCRCPLLGLPLSAQAHCTSPWIGPSLVSAPQLVGGKTG